MKFDNTKLIEIPIVDLDDIYLRAIEYEDYKDMFEYGSDKRVTNTLSWEYDTLEEAITSIKDVHLSRPLRDLPITYAIIHKNNEKMIGTCDFHKIDWDTLVGEIGYVIHFDYWGKGYMTKTCNALIDFGFQYLGLNKIVISHELKNIGSQRVIEKCGFRFIDERIHHNMETLNKFYEMNKRDYIQK